MLKLHSLEISGFKSFLDPVQVRFADGITAIVGPNGCGKSNLTDAINWVLGEQSAKSLRGAKMEDVIFNGTNQRKPVGMAEVSLILATDNGFPRAENGRIKIGRQVFRSGEGRYRINDKVVRLKEIKDLLMDTGLGVRAYSVIEQGKIGLILSNKPQERRKLLEEAAGITRYKARKRIAEVKLEETLANLMRLDDIVSEVERALRSLKRQASAARRYQAKETEYKDLLRKVLLGRWRHVKHRLDELHGRLTGQQDQDAELAADLAKAEAELAAARQDLDELSAELGRRHQRQAELAAVIEGRQEFIRGSRQRAQEMQERLHSGRTLADERRRQTDEFQKSLGSLDQRTREVLDERDEAARLVAEDDRKIAAAHEEVQQAEQRLESLRRELMQSVSQLNQTRSQLQRQTVELERADFRLDFLDAENVRLEGQLQEADVTLQAVREKIRGLDGSLAKDVETLEGKRTELDTLLRREAESSDESRDLEARLTGLEQRRQILAELSKEHAERRRRLEETLAKVGIEEPRFLAEAVKSREGWEDGIDHFLGELADAVLLDGETDALETARALSEVNASGVFIRSLGSPSSTPDSVDDPAVVASLAEALDVSPELGSALPPAYLVEKADDALRLASQHPGVAFLSRNRLWSQGGALWVQGEEAAPGVLARERELEEIRDEIPRTQTRLEELRDALRKLVQQRTQLAGEIRALDDKTSELRREIAVAQARCQDAETRREKIRGELQGVSTERDDLRGERSEYRDTKDGLARRVADLETAHRQQTDSFDRVQAEVQDAKDRREALRTEGAGRRGRLELLEERLDAQSQEAARVRNQITYTEEQLTIWADEDQSLDRRLSELDLAVEGAEKELQVALEQKSGAETAVLEQQEKLDGHREAIRGLEVRVQDLRRVRDEVRGLLESLRVEQASARQDAEHLSVSYREAFQRYIPGTKPSETEPAPPPEPSTETPEPTSDSEDVGEGETTSPDIGQTPDRSTVGEDDGFRSEPQSIQEDDVEIPTLGREELADLEAELARTKAVLERLGPVNVLAAHEYQEQEERREFLRKQRRDVADSVQSLRQTIREINETSSERFRETFVEVNTAFGEIFQSLFRGGEAEMRLFDEEDLLETGIEIVARPPGKRTQNISLLSGGEKALTAAALLFALFRTKPSPFCILDEVDAPLDDANVLRFVDLLQGMALDTQFLVVTHNKLTMEVASRLYGVTMQEKGVSKLVQASLEELHPLVENAA
ncbi:MAG: chromosome segregation protein SMC [Thermoanaerobaculia bacterium]|nr:chromosome segregation protein SMC [Thermoanaerobaculia bacterium]